MTSYDAVVIDCNMPKMTGPDAVLEMRRIGFRGPIIGVSGNEDEEDPFLRSGADCMLVKPVERTTLTAALSAAWAKRANDVNANFRHAVANAIHSPRANGANFMSGSSSVAHNGAGGREESDSVSAPNSPRGSMKVSRTPPLPGGALNLALRLPTSTQGQQQQQQQQLQLHPKRGSRNAGASQGGNGLQWASAKSSKKVAPRPSMQSQSKHDAVSEGAGAGAGAGAVDEGDPDEQQLRELIVRSSSHLNQIVHVPHTDVFLNFQSEAFRSREVLAEFKEFRRADWNAHLSVACVVLTVVYVVTRYSLEHLWYLNPAFGLTFASLLIYAACVGVNFFCRLAVYSERLKWAAYLRRYRYACNEFYGTRWGQLLEVRGCERLATP